MSILDSPAEDYAMLSWSEASVTEGVINADPFTYQDATTAERLRSGTDGPHTSLADRLCGINRTEY